jgi:hypothetical protein
MSASFRVGDRVLVECVIEKIDGPGDFRFLSKLSDGRDSNGGWAGPQMIRPWTESPPEPVRELWRGEAETGFPVRVMSDGTPWVDVGSGWVEPNQDHQVLILAQYVRETAVRP